MPKYYQDSVEELRRMFSRLNLIVYGEAAVRFADNEVLRVLTTSSAYCDYESMSQIGHLVAIDRDGDGMMTQAESACIKSLSNRPDINSSVLAENSIISTFDELRYFTGLTFLSGGMFKNCTSLKAITLPAGISSIKNEVFYGTAIQKLVIPKGCTEIGSGLVAFNTALLLVDLPSTVIILGDAVNRNGSLQFKLICRAATPPTFNGAWWDNSSKGLPIAIYVPDSSVTAYKTATGWSRNANLIQPLSIYKE